jgi:hypothetical protein
MQPGTNISHMIALPLRVKTNNKDEGQDAREEAIGMG